jgi:hypothetical protein
VSKLKPNDPGPSVTFIRPTTPGGATTQAYEYQERVVGTTDVLNDYYLTDTAGNNVITSPGIVYYSSCGASDRCEYRIRALVQSGASAWSTIW